MAKVDLGDKQICPSCGAKFYDLRRRPATCPKCATNFDPAEEGVRLKRSRSKVAAYSDDEEEEVEAKKAEVGDDEEEEEAAEAPGLDKETPEEIVVGDDEEVEASGDELPPGFSEEEADLEEDPADDALPILEDEEEFPEDEIGEIPASDEEEGGR